MVDISRATSGVNLPPAVATEIMGATQEASAVMRLARRVNLPGNGVSIPLVTGEATAAWVDETSEKPVSRATVSNKTMTAYKLAVIEPFSNEFRRDLPALYGELVRRLPFALGKKFDQTVFDITVAAPGSNFDKLSGATAVGIAGNTWAGLVAAVQAVSTAGGEISGWAMSPQGIGVLLGKTDGNNRPLFLDGIGDATVPRLLGAPVATSRAVYAADADGAGVGTDAQYGYVGDWTQAVYGTVEGVQISVSDQATVNDGGTQLNLWQRNMFAVRAEIEVGFRVRDLALFAKLTSATQA